MKVKSGLNFAILKPMSSNLAFINDIPILLVGVFGERTINVRSFLDFKPGYVLELDKLAGEPIDLYMNGTFIAKGEVIIINEKFGVRLTDIVEKGIKNGK